MSISVASPTVVPLPGARRVLSLLVTACCALGSGACTDATADGTDDPHSSTSSWARLQAQGVDTVVAARSSALMAAPAKRTRTAAAMLFDIGGAPNKTNVTTLLTGPGASLLRMYNEISFGLQQVQVDIYGPYTLPVKNCLTIACCGPSSDKTGNGATVQSLIDALPMKYDHYFWDYGLPLPAGANCGTWGDEGTPATPAVYSSYSFQGIVGQAQELGHNLGMTHEPTLTCTGAKTFLDDSTQCTHVEYGSTLSFMGGGAHHPSAYHKYAQGWIGKCNVVTVGTSGTFNLVPQELPCDGAQLLQIAAPKVRAAPAKGDRQGTGPMLSHYYVEMRAPIGFDTGLKPMVVISIGAALPTTRMAAPYLYVLDMVPEAGKADLSNAGLMTVGQSYTDPVGGLTITLMSINAQGASINVTTTATGTNTCVDATPFVAPGPDGTSCASLAGGDGGIASTGGAGGRAAGTGGATGTGGGAGKSGAGGSAGNGGGGANVSTGGAPVVSTGGAAMATGGASVGTGGTNTGGTASGGRGEAATGGAAPATGGQGAPIPATTTGCACNTGPFGGTAADWSASWLLAACAILQGRRSRRARS